MPGPKSLMVCDLNSLQLVMPSNADARLEIRSGAETRSEGLFAVKSPVRPGKFARRLSFEL